MVQNKSITRKTGLKNSFLTIAYHINIYGIKGALFYFSKDLK